MAPGVAQAQTREQAFREGVHYQRLPVPVESSDLDHIEILEFFSYGCIHCFNFDPLLERWVRTLPEDVLFRRVPVIFNKTWQTYAQAYYTADVLGVGEEAHLALFTSIHQNRRRLDDETALARFFSSFGVNENAFRSTFNSFGIRTKVRQADALGKIYRLTGVPTLAIAGKYRVSPNRGVSFATLLEVADFLLSEERDLRATLAIPEPESPASSEPEP